MNEIKAGDKVLNPGFGERTVVAVDGNSAWIRAKDGWECIAKLSNLTRIEPEKITLTPKFKLGEKICPRDGYPQTILAVSVSYRLAPNGTWWEEEEVDLVPTPCPTCKGSGKASE